MSFWNIANIAAWVLSGLLAVLIAADFIRTEKGNQKKAETRNENGGPAE
jgi:hypothetical protein